MKIYMKSINTAYKQVWVVKMFPGNTKCAHSIKHGKIYLTLIHVKIFV